MRLENLWRWRLDSLSGQPMPQLITRRCYRVTISSFNSCQLSFILLPYTISWSSWGLLWGPPPHWRDLNRLNKSSCPSFSSQGRCSSSAISVASPGFDPVYWCLLLGSTRLDAGSRWGLTSTERRWIMTPLCLCPCSFSPDCCWPLLLPLMAHVPPCPPGPPEPFPQSCSQQLVPAHTWGGVATSQGKGCKSTIRPWSPWLSLPMDTISAQPGATSPCPTDGIGHWSPSLCPPCCGPLCRLTTAGQAAIPEQCLTLVPLTGTDPDLQIDVPAWPQPCILQHYTSFFSPPGSIKHDTVSGDLWLSEVRELKRLKTKARRKPDLIIPPSRNLFFIVCMHRDLMFMLFRTRQNPFVLSLLCMWKSRLAQKLDLILLQPCKPSPIYSYLEILSSSSKW